MSAESQTTTEAPSGQPPDPAEMSDAELSVLTLVRACGWRWAHQGGGDFYGLVPPKGGATTGWQASPDGPDLWHRESADFWPARRHADWDRCCCKMQTPQGPWISYLPPVAADVGSFFAEVVPAMQKRDKRLSLCETKGTRTAGAWWWQVGFLGPGRSGIAIEESLPRAGCLAALASIVGPSAGKGDANV